MKSAEATDWRAVERRDGTVFLECGSPTGPYHEAFDVSCDRDLAVRFCTAMNSFNGSGK